MEIWDGYLEDGTLSGVDLIRGESIPEGQYHMVCEVLVRHADGDYLLMLRDPGKDVHPGKWEATAGGSALKGEDKLACIRRELKEETGLSAEEFTEIASEVYYAKNALFYSFLCVVEGDKDGVTLQPGETVDYRWVSPREFIEYVNSGNMMPGQRRRYDGYYRENGYVKEDEIPYLIRQFCRNMEEKKILDDRLLEIREKDAWMEALRVRGERIQEMWQENSRIIGRIYEWLKLPLTEELAEKLYQQVEYMYINDFDTYALLDMALHLVDYYEKQGNIDHLIRLYACVDFERNEIWERRIGGEHYDQFYIRKVLQFKDRYAELTDVRKRRGLFVAYYNVIIAGRANGLVTVDESYQLLREMLEFWNSPMVQNLDRETEAVSSVVEQTQREWFAVEEHIEEASAETQEAFCRMVEKFYEQHIAEGSEEDCDNDVYTAYLHALVLRGELTWQQAIERYFAYYQTRVEKYRRDCKLEDEDFYFLINVPLNLESWLHREVPEELRKRIIEALRADTRDILYPRMHGRWLPFVDERLTEWCFCLLPYLEGDAEKEKWLFRLLVQRQLHTYLHSVMVKNLALEIFDAAMKEKPEVFGELAKEAREELREFVRRCALFHDLGKTKITDIINTQTRNLTDQEFQTIRRHPDFGSKLIEGIPVLQKYHDVIMGHHKFYNGEGGYPPGYDNTISPYRVIVDLITICDCIDAATDGMGRSYKAAKTFPQVLEELVRGKGVRYQPDLVEIMEQSKELQQRLSAMVSTQRLETAFCIYTEA